MRFLKEVVWALAVLGTFSSVCEAASPPAGDPGTPEHTTAEQPRRPVDVDLGVLVGYGSKEFDLSKDTPNPFNVGFGFAGGVTMLDAAYLGASFVYYVGQNGPNAINSNTGAAGPWRMSTLTTTLDAGYRFRFQRLRDLTIRPYVGVGLLERMVSIPGASASTHNLLVAPSVAVQVPITGSGFVGADLRFGLRLAESDTHANISAFAFVGYRL